MITLAVKAILTLVAVMVLVFIMGVSGMLFVIWPTGLGDRALIITPTSLASLRELQLERKFLEDRPNHYPGAPNEAIRVAAQASVDALVGDLTNGLPKDPRRALVLGRMKAALASFQPTDSEERDQLLRYCERILLIIGIESSGELLNVWRYGLPYGWMQAA